MPDPQPAIQSVASFLFTFVILPLVSYLVLAGTPKVLAWLSAQEQAVKARLTTSQWQMLSMLARDVAAQVEQAKKTGLIPSNDAALKWACQQLHALLILRGIDLPLDNLVTAIESAVNDLPHTSAAPKVSSLPSGQKWE